MSYTNGLDKPSNYFNNLLYTGNGTDATGITGVGFQPDLVWIKERSSTSPHKLLDAVRGATKELESSSTALEQTESTSLQSFDSDGFTVGTNGAVNENSQTYASWNWLASNTTASNTDGSITSTVSANTTSGFSIVSYTGNGSGSATVGHGLGVIPSMVFIKARTSGSANGYWYVKHKSLTSNYNIYLNVTDAASNVTSFSQGGIGDLDNVNTFDFASGTSGITTVNASGTDFIAYCFAEKQGYSKFGSYVGTGNVSGPYIHLGFKPAFTLIKAYSIVDKWSIFDAKRNPFNEVDLNIRANQNDAEVDQAGKEVDYLSNGIKLRTASGEWNSTGTQYIYMSFAENPFVTSTGVPATAR